MKKNILPLLTIALMLTGCSVEQIRDVKLNSITGLSVEKNGGIEYIKQYQQKIKLTNPGLSKLKICVSRNVTNREVNLTDSSGSFYGSYSGRYYNIQKGSTIQGGDIIDSYDSAGTIIAHGNSSYLFSSGIISVKRVVRFTLDIVPSKTDVIYTFSNIQQAQLDSGTLPNNGFSNVGTWEGAGPVQVVDVLKKTVSDISTCQLGGNN